jgi:hypothetical protein
LRRIIYNHATNPHDRYAFGETLIPWVRQPQQLKEKIMGDKSPKANQKKSGQKQSKANNATASKSAATAAKQAAGKKK